MSLICLSYSSFAQGFSSETQAKLQNVIDSFENHSSNPFVGGISAAIKYWWLAL